MRDVILMMAFYSITGTVDAGVTLLLDTRTIKIGDSMILTCTVHGISKINTNITRQFAKGNDGDLLCYNGHITQTRKYEEILSGGNSFSLMINNVTESDVNSIYKCRYEFSTVKQMIRVNETNFEYGPTENTTLIQFNEYDNKSFEIHISFTKIFPVPCCLARIKKLQLKFANTSVMKENIFYKVSFVLIYAVDSQCGTDLRIHCTVGKSKHHIGTLQPFMECPSGTILDRFQMFVIASTSIGSVILVALLVLYKTWKPCKKKASNSKTSKKEEASFL